MVSSRRRLFNDTHSHALKYKSARLPLLIGRLLQTEAQTSPVRVGKCLPTKSRVRGATTGYTRYIRESTVVGTLSAQRRRSRKRDIARSNGQRTIRLTSRTKGHQGLRVVVDHIVLYSYGFHGQPAQYMPEEVLGRDERDVPL